MRKRIIKIVATLCLVYVGILTLMYFMQENLIFFPEKLAPNYTYSFEGNFKEVNFETGAGISINALHFKADTTKGLVLYFHGNAGSLASWGGVAADFTPHGYDVLIMDFRGYGESTGKIQNEEGLHHDAEFIYKEMLKEYKEENIIVYGRSIGTGMASKLAAAHAPKQLVLETPYFNFPDLVKNIYPFVPGFLVKYKLANDTHIPEVKCRVSLIHGTKDEIVPYDHSVRLAPLAKDIRFYTIDGGIHNNLSGFEEFHNALKKILG